MSIAKTCSIAECNLRYLARGLCRKHYQNLWRNGDPVAHRPYNSGIVSGHPLYQTFSGMHKRCYHENCSDYPNYGGRGIAVCDEWSMTSQGFNNFINHMAPKPTPKHTLDRIDNDKGYSPENCRWATAHEQNLNKRKRRVWGWSSTKQTKGLALKKCLFCNEEILINGYPSAYKRRKYCSLSCYRNFQGSQRLLAGN